MRTNVLLAAALGSLLLMSQPSAAEYEFHYPLSGYGSAPASNLPSGAFVPTQIDCGVSHCYAIAGSTIWSVGNNSSGQLGLGDTTNRLSWTDTKVPADKVFAGFYFGYAIKDGELLVVGNNGRGQLGLGDAAPTSLATWTATGVQNVIDAAGGHSHGYIIVANPEVSMTNGEVYSAGKNAYGQLGIGSLTDASTWTPTGRYGYNVDAGQEFGMIRGAGRIYSAGQNNNGQLALGTAGNALTWSDTGLGGSVVSLGYYHSMAVKNQRVYGAGNDSYGQLGMWTPDTRSWYLDSKVENVVKIVSGGHHTYRINADGYYSVHGYNGYGAFGTTQTYFKLKADMMAAGEFFGYRLLDGVLYASGRNDSGQLGLGDTSDRSSWTALENPFVRP